MYERFHVEPGYSVIADNTGYIYRISRSNPMKIETCIRDGFVYYIPSRGYVLMKADEIIRNIKISKIS